MSLKQRILAASLLAIYVGLVVTANVMTSHLGLLPAGFGLMVTAGTFAAGLTIAVRNPLEEAAGMVRDLAESWRPTPEPAEPPKFNYCGRCGVVRIKLADDSCATCGWKNHPMPEPAEPAKAPTSTLVATLRALAAQGYGISRRQPSRPTRLGDLADRIEQGGNGNA